MSAGLSAFLPKGRCRLLLGASIGLASVSAALALTPAVILYAIAEVVVHRGDVYGLTVMQIIFSAIGAAIIRLALLLWARVAAGSATMLATERLRAELAAKIGTLPMGLLSEERPAALAAQLLEDVERLGAFLSGTFVDLVGSAAMILAATLFVAARDWELGAILAIATAAGWLAGGFRPALPPALADRDRRAREALVAAGLRALRGAVPEKALPPVAADADPLRAYASAYRTAALARAARVAALDAGQRAYAGAIPALAIVAGAWFLPDRLDLPALVLVAAVGVRAGGALSAALGARAAAAPALDSARRIARTLAQPSLPSEGAEPPADATVAFHGVAFAYPGGREVLRDVTFTAAPGTMTAIVGPSGSGKTTLLRLVAGFWTPDRGTVTLGGCDLRTLSSDALMERVAWVFQDVALLNDTIAANLRLGRPDADEAQLCEAARIAGAHGFISALPDGYETVLGERGLRLSRGERQRLQIARALLKDAPLVLLDEPTASLDPATEGEIQRALVPLVSGKTVIAVTHRLGTIVDADAIVVLDREGQVEATGRHAQLLETSPTYARLWADYDETTSPAPVAHASIG